METEIIDWKYRNFNKLNRTPPVVLNNKLPNSMCYCGIINQFKWFWKVESYIPANMKNSFYTLLQIIMIMV